MGIVTLVYKINLKKLHINSLYTLVPFLFSISLWGMYPTLSSIICPHSIK
jgi:hypothetical protein